MMIFNDYSQELSDVIRFVDVFSECDSIKKADVDHPNIGFLVRDPCFALGRFAVSSS